MDKNDVKIPELVKAYENMKFMHSADARPIRLLSEYLEPLYRLRKNRIKDTVVFYGSARLKSKLEARNEYKRLKLELQNDDDARRGLLAKQLEMAERQVELSRYYEEARKLAHDLTEWSKSLEQDKRFIVCSGGGPGIMEAANRGAREADGVSIGLNISLPMEQYPNPYITEDLSFEFHYFFMRKFWFVYLAKALVVFPGGFGTLDELFELLTLRQTEKVKKPLCVVVYGNDYWNSIVDFKKMAEWGVISEEDLDLFFRADSVEEAFNFLRQHFEKEFVGDRKYWYL
ncbi:TIGR00730 family Rossman fold protein [candidate division KSB1 bacterium]|nr:TIGR00730 family Rossman fold protein [candidate division KSB1 bacterium]